MSDVLLVQKGQPSFNLTCNCGEYFKLTMLRGREKEKEWRTKCPVCKTQFDVKIKRG